MKKKTFDTVSFDIDAKDTATVKAIAERAANMAQGDRYPIQDAMMDIQACHANGNPLRFDDLLQAADGDFAHDVFGIRYNLNREVGKLMNLFRPRHSV